MCRFANFKKYVSSYFKTYLDQVLFENINLFFVGIYNVLSYKIKLVVSFKETAKIHAVHKQIPRFDAKYPYTVLAMRHCHAV